MESEAVTKFTWVIKNFSSLESKFIHSDEFVVGGCKWRLVAYPNGDKDESFLPLYLMVCNYKTLPCGWIRHAKFSMIIVNHISETLSERKEKQTWFDRMVPFSGFKTIIPASKLYDKDGGFLVNNEVKIVAEVEVVKVVGELDVLLESQEVTRPLKKFKLNDDGVESKDLPKEMVDVNGFQVLPSQVEFVSRVFKKYPDIALQIRAKNETLRASCMFVFLGLIETLCKSLQELSNDDVMQADSSLTFLKCSGIKVDWLEQKLEEVKVKKKQEQIGETRMQELEEELKGVKQNCSDIEASLKKIRKELKNLKQKKSDIEALLEKEKANVLAARAPALTLDEVV
ncbi:hypothetical protein AALP_AA5G226800 [Arabis alpina]|uniref:MATH domain-containing protein n=1 Tax=Arabis alpina TaxID=50452 RepID=A0A087GYU1_ARAAL|nr:hypothetical protein AALP_AA5G226800 [Arabis alpina]